MWKYSMTLSYIYLFLFENVFYTLKENINVIDIG